MIEVSKRADQECVDGNMHSKTKNGKKCFYLSACKYREAEDCHSPISNAT